MTTLHGTGKLTYSLSIIIAQSSATLVPHMQPLQVVQPLLGVSSTCVEVALKISSTLFSILEELLKRQVIAKEP